MGRCKGLGSLKSFLSYESQLSGTSILWFSHHELPRAQDREWLQSDGSEIRYPFPSWVPLDSGTHTGEWESVKTVKSLFIDIAGNIPVLTASKMYSKTKYFILLNFTHYNQLQDANTCPPSYCLSILTCHTESTVSPIVLSQWLSLLWLRIFHLLLNYIG